MAFDGVRSSVANGAKGRVAPPRPRTWLAAQMLAVARAEVPGPGQRCPGPGRACTWLAGDYAAIGGRCWPEPAAVGSAEHDTHRGLSR